MTRVIYHRAAGPAERQWCLNLALKKYGDPVVGVDPAAAAEAAQARFDLFDVITVDGVVRAYICASVIRPQPHSYARVMQQMYYHTTAEGVLAVKLLRYAHSLLVEEGRRRGLAACVSSSMNDNWETMYRILTLDGWSRSGPRMYFKLQR